MNNINVSKYDAVLICNTNEFLTEASGDERYFGKTTPSADKGLKSQYLMYDDPKLYASNAFGKALAYELNSWRQGYSTKVTDFGKWVVADVTYHNHITGRTAGKTFLIVFTGDPKTNNAGSGMIMSTANKYRTISGYGQAVTYIKSASSTLEGTTSQKL